VKHFVEHRQEMATKIDEIQVTAEVARADLQQLLDRTKDELKISIESRIR
jgi:hypothetical protein